MYKGEPANEHSTQDPTQHSTLDPTHDPTHDPTIVAIREIRAITASTRGSSTSLVFVIFLCPTFGVQFTNWVE